MIMCLAAAVQEVMGQLRASWFRTLRRDHKVAEVRGALQGTALRRQSPLRSSMDSSIQNVLNTRGIRDSRLIVPGHAGVPSSSSQGVPVLGSSLCTGWSIHPVFLRAPHQEFWRCACGGHRGFAHAWAKTGWIPYERLGLSVIPG